MSVEHTIGLGVVHRGELFRGANGLSPDLGDMVVAPDGCGSNGAGPSRLSALASTTSILTSPCELVRGTADEPLLRGPRAISHLIDSPPTADKHGARSCSRPGRRSASPSPT